MDATRPTFWQITALSAILPIMGLWPTILSVTQSQLDGSQLQPVTTAIQKAIQPAQIFPLPQVAEYGVKKVVRLTVTAYSSTVDQTDSDPFTTASGMQVRDGIIAHNFLPFGTRVRFPDAFGDKVFIVEDRLHAGKGYYIADMWMPTREDAKQWGAQVERMEILSDDTLVLK